METIVEEPSGNQPQEIEKSTQEGLHIILMVLVFVVFILALLALSLERPR